LERNFFFLLLRQRKKSKPSQIDPSEENGKIIKTKSVRSKSKTKLSNLFTFVLASTLAIYKNKNPKEV
jgi:hypothetical protein